MAPSCLLLLTAVSIICVEAKLASSRGLAAGSAMKTFEDSQGMINKVYDIVGTATTSTTTTTGSHNALRLVALFFLWYGFNAAYNVFNALMKRDFKFPLTTATAQLLIGLVYALPLWIFGARKVPSFSTKDLTTLLPIAFLNTLGHTATVCATFEKGGGSFTHVIKAAEPVVSVLLNLIVSGIIPKPLTSISMLPISYGVAYASTLGKLSVDTMSTELTTKAAK
jgi:drug/metabolite transporter (DMT)-like permease